MKILIDINHPAHVHFFKHAISNWEKSGNKIIIVARSKDVIMDLLDKYQLPYITGTTRKGGLVNLGLEFLHKIALIVKEGWRFKPDLILSIGSPPAAWASRLLGVQHITFDDTERQWEQRMFYAPFSKVIFTPSCFKKNLGKKQIRYDGYHELAYLHPNRFKPNKEVLREAEINEDDIYFIVRFVSWQATHDLGEYGFSRNGKMKLVNELNKLGKVIITSEVAFPPEYE